jgi:hypothetical protein
MRDLTLELKDMVEKKALTPGLGRLAGPGRSYTPYLQVHAQHGGTPRLPRGGRAIRVMAGTRLRTGGKAVVPETREARFAFTLSCLCSCTDAWRLI